MTPPYKINALPSDLLDTEVEYERSIKVNAHKTPLGYDAWGRSKAVQDHSLFHGLWTTRVPPEMWIELANGVEQPITSCTSINGMLNVTAPDINTNIALMSKRHPRYQPNRGHLFSCSALFPDADKDAIQIVGLRTNHSGVFFKVHLGKLYYVRRTTVFTPALDISNFQVDLTEYLPDGFDLTKGNLYDIQMQWRGVGDIKIFINQEHIYTDELLGTVINTIVFNPALPLEFEIEPQTENANFNVICADITSEGGVKERRQRVSFDTDEISLANAEVPVLLFHSKTTIPYYGTETMNTLDMALRRVSGFADDNTVMRVYYSRDETQFTGTTFTDYGISNFETSINGLIVLPNLYVNLQRIGTKRIPANGSIDITNPDEQYGDFYVTHGDFILITMFAKNATVGGATMEGGAEV